MQPQGQPQYGGQPAYGQPPQQPQYGPPPGQYPQQPAYQPQPQYAPQLAPVQQYQPQPAPQQLGGVPTFTKPADAPANDRLKAGDAKGHLLIVVPISHHVGYFPAKAETEKTKAQPAQDAIRVNVVDLDARDPYGNAGKVYNGVMWGGVLLCPGLARQIGEVTLGVMVEGQARGANSAPLKLESRAEDGQAVQRATEFYTRRPDWQNQPSDADPIAPPVQPAPQQYAQPAPVQQYQPQPQMMQPQQAYGQPNAGMPPQPYPAQPQYDPAAQYAQHNAQMQQGGYQQPGQQAPQQPYQPGTVPQYDPAAAAMYANVQAQQQPGQYQG